MVSSRWLVMRRRWYTVQLELTYSGRALGVDVDINGVCIDPLLDHLVLISTFLGVLGHLLDLFLRHAALVVCDGDLLTLASALVIGSTIQVIVGVNLGGLLNEAVHEALEGFRSARSYLGDDCCPPHRKSQTHRQPVS